MQVGDKVWVMLGGWQLANDEAWGKAVVVPEPEGVVPRRGTVCVVIAPFEEVYRVSKSNVKERND